MSGLPLVLTMGDPSGCGPQITAAAWKQSQQHGLKPFCVIGDTKAYEPFCPVIKISEPVESTCAFGAGLPVISAEKCALEPYDIGTPNTRNAPAIIESIRYATDLTLQQKASGLVTNPISKAVLYEAGFKHPGHTEFVAAICDEYLGQDSHIQPIMMLAGGGLKVALATIHIPLLDVPKLLDQQRLLHVARTLDKALRENYGIENPCIAFTGLNPHAGEQGSIGTEELEIINPTAQQLRSEGINISDARSADTIFHEALNGAFDAVIAMTHDQGLIPVKTLDMWGGVNTTLGLPIVRTSPDHGTAYEAAADRACRADSLIAAIKHAETVASYRSNT